MKTWIRAIFIVACLAFAATTRAQSIDIGDRDYSYVTITITANSYIAASIYKDGELVFAADQGGVFYASPLVSYNNSYNYYYSVSLPPGHYTLEASTPYGGYYETSNNVIYWHSNDGWSWAYVEFEY